MGPVDERTQMFTLDCYFRQYWTDRRLVFARSRQEVSASCPTCLTLPCLRVKELTLNWQFLSRIWRPDTYFLNGQESYLHNIVVPNRFIRVAHTGRVSFSQRLTLTARYSTWLLPLLLISLLLNILHRCKMDLSKFPHDSQVALSYPAIQLVTHSRCAPSTLAALATTRARCRWLHLGHFSFFIYLFSQHIFPRHLMG